MSPQLQAWIRDVIRSATRTGRSAVGLSIAGIEGQLRARLPGQGLDLKRIRGYRTDRPPKSVSREFVAVLAEVCGVPADDGLRLWDQAHVRTALAGSIETSRTMYGRAAEMAACTAAISEALERPRLLTLLLIGDAGFGKSVLVQAIETFVQAPPSRAEVVRVSTGAGLHGLEARFAGDLPSFSQKRVSYPASSDFEEALRLHAEALRDALLARAARCAMLVVLEDLHFASTPVVDVVSQLADQIVNCPLVLLATTRPNRRVVAALEQAETTLSLSLTPLTLTDIRELVDDRAIHLEAPERVQLATALLECTDGHPAGVSMVIEQHLAGGEWRPGESVLTARHSAVRRTVERWKLRATALPSATLTALQAAAVVGIRADVRMLRQLPHVRSVGDRVAGALESAIDAGIVRWDTQAGEPSAHYEFRHELARDALLELTRPPLQAEIHHQVADVLDSPLGEVLQPDPLLRAEGVFVHRRAALPHYVEEAQAVAGAALQYGEAQLQALDEPSASDAFESGLHALELLYSPSSPVLQAKLLRGLAACPSTPTERRRVLLKQALDGLLAKPDVDPRLMVELAWDYSLMNPFGSEDRDIGTTCERVLATLGPNDMELKARLESRLCLHHIWCLQAGSEPGRATELAGTAWEHAHKSGSRVAMIDALDAGGALLYAEPDAESMRDVGRRMRELGTRLNVYELIGPLRLGDRDGFEDAFRAGLTNAGMPWPEPWMHLAFCSQFEALRAFLVGDLVAAVNHGQDVINRYHERDPNFAQIATGTWLWATYQSGSPDAARHMADVGAMQFSGQPVLQASRALLAARCGDEPAAREILHKLLAPGRPLLRKDPAWLVLQAVLAETISLVELHEYSAPVYRSLEPFAGQILVLATGVFCYGAADRYLGILAPLVPNRGLSQAKHHFERAAQLEEHLRAPALRARTLFWFARTLARHGELDDLLWAKELLDDAEAATPGQLEELRSWIASERSWVTSRAARRRARLAPSNPVQSGN